MLPFINFKEVIMRNFLLFLCAMILMAGSAVATPITSNSDAALTGASVMDFESATQGTYAAITVNDVTFTAGNYHLRIDDDYQQYNSSGRYLDNGTYNNNGFQSLTIDFSTDVSAFGFNWSMAESWATWILTAYDSGNNVIEAYVLPNTGSSSAGEFYGLAAAGTSYATIVRTVGDYDWISLDNLTYVTSGAIVPEPATMLLFALGLLGLAGVNRRKN